MIHMTKSELRIKENVDKPISGKETYLVIKNLPIKEKSRPRDFIGKYYQTYKKK